MASIYTSRQLLDPNWLAKANAMEQQEYQQRLNSLGETANWFRDWRNRKDEEAKQARDMNTRAALLGDYGKQGPVEAAVANRFIETGDASGIMNVENNKIITQSRQDEINKGKAEALELKKQKFELAKREIDSYSKPAERISAIKNAIDKGIDAKEDVTELENLLELEQEAKGKAEFIEKEKEWDKAQETKQNEIKKRTKKLIEEFVSRLKDIDDKDEYNQTLNELKTMAKVNGLRSEIKFPDKMKKSRTVRTAKEEDEYIDLLELKSDYDKGLSNQWTTVQQSRLDKLSKMKPFWSK